MEKVYIPYEIFQKLPKKDSDLLQEDLMYIYFKESPDALQDIIDRADGDADLIDMYKEQKFQDVITKDYAFDIDILRKRKSDEIADQLVKAIDEYNLMVEQQDS